MSTSTDLQWGLEKLGEWSEEKPFAVTRERIAQYAEATNDEHPAHRAGDLAPPVFAIVPVFEVLAPAIAGVVPPEVLMRGVHGQQDFRYHRPIEPGQGLVSRAVPLGIAARSTGAVVLGKAETRTDGGELVLEQWMTYFVRGVEIAESVGEPLPEHGFPRSCARPSRRRRSSTATTPTRRSATAPRRATRCRSISTTTSRRRWAFPGSSSTGSARWRSARAR
jgi:acyl dehydratase